MKRREINERPDWTFWVPDAVADWDAPSHWERERLFSMEHRLTRGDVLFDVGTEHGWLTAVYGGFVGHANVVLFEPAPSLWPNIRLTWEHNEFPAPLAAFWAFVGARSAGEPDGAVWPEPARGPLRETGAQAYEYLHNTKHTDIPTVSIDDAARIIGRAPKAITIDVEGAEVGVLQGAVSTLANDRPMVWVSIHPDLMFRDYGTVPLDIYGLMVDLDYAATHLATDHEEHWFFEPAEWTR